MTTPPYSNTAEELNRILRFLNDEDDEILDTTILQRHLQVSYDIQKKLIKKLSIKNTASPVEKKEVQLELTPEQKRFLLSPIDDSELSTRIKNVMKDADIITFLDLCKYTRRSISNFYNIGENSLIQIKNIIEYNHLRLATDYTKYLSNDLESKEN